MICYWTEWIVGGHYIKEELNMGFNTKDYHQIITRRLNAINLQSYPV